MTVYAHGAVLLPPAVPGSGRFRGYRDRSEAFAYAMRARRPG